MPVRVLGLDPGTATTGFGVVEGEMENLQLVEYGAILTPAGMPMPERLGLIYLQLNQLFLAVRVASLPSGRRLAGFTLLNSGTAPGTPWDGEWDG